MIQMSHFRSLSPSSNLWLLYLLRYTRQSDILSYDGETTIVVTFSRHRFLKLRLRDQSRSDFGNSRSIDRVLPVVPPSSSNGCSVYDFALPSCFYYVAAVVKIVEIRFSVISRYPRPETRSEISETRDTRSPKPEARSLKSEI